MTLRVGDAVIWRGSWGTDTPRVTIVTEIEHTREQNDKYGVAVDELPWARVRAGFAVVSLENGHWAYGHQLMPLSTATLEQYGVEV